MNKLLEALPLAEEALDMVVSCGYGKARERVENRKALATIRAAIAQEKAEQESKPPKWYTREEIIQVLGRMNYCEPIAQELADWFVLHLQHAFNKGFQEGQREMHAPQKREWMELSDGQKEREWQFLHDEEGNPPNHFDYADAVIAAFKEANK